jgi:hypothetical protein
MIKNVHKLWHLWQRTARLSEYRLVNRIANPLSITYHHTNCNRSTCTNDKDESGVMYELPSGPTFMD